MLAFALPLIGYGIIFNLGFAAVGVVVMFIAIYGWGLEPSFVDDGGHGHGGDDHGGHDAPDGDTDAAAAALPAEDATTDSDSTDPAATEEAPVG